MRVRVSRALFNLVANTYAAQIQSYAYVYEATFQDRQGNLTKASSGSARYVCQWKKSTTSVMQAACMFDDMQPLCTSKHCLSICQKITCTQSLTKSFLRPLYLCLTLCPYLKTTVKQKLTAYCISKPAQCHHFQTMCTLNKTL